MSCDEKWTCQKWSCEELWWAVELCVLRLPRQALCLCTAGCQAKGSRGPAAATAPQLLQKALCTAPAMQKGSAEALCTARARQKAAAGQRLLQKALCTAPATQKGSAEALCTAPAKQKAAAGQRRPPRRSSARKLCVLRLPRKREVRRLKCRRSVYCACQAKGSRGPAAATAPQLLQKALCTVPATHKGSAEALCTAPARQKAAAGQRRPPRRNSARKLCVLHLPRKREVRRLCVLRLPGKRQPRASGGHCAAALCTAPARQKAAAGQQRPPCRSSARKLCVLRLPRKREVRRLCVLRLPHESQPRPSGAHARRSSSWRLCVLHLPRERQPGSSVYCACHAKAFYISKLNVNFGEVWEVRCEKWTCDVRCEK